MRSRRNGGTASRGSCPSPVAPRAAGGHGPGGRAATTRVSASRTHGCTTAFGALVTPVARTPPGAGRNRGSNLAVPPRTDAWGWRAG